MRRVLVQHLIVLADRGHEDDGHDIIEAVYPLFPLVALAADVVHRKFDVIDYVLLLDDAARSDARVEHVELIGEVIGAFDAVDMSAVVCEGILYLKVGSNVPELLKARVSPEVLDLVAEGRRDRRLRKRQTRGQRSPRLQI